MDNTERRQKRNLKVGVQEITVQHFTNEITNLPFIMDSNCFIAFSLLWRRYMSHSLNENLITEDGWFQYTMKSLGQHCGFKDKGTLQRTVEGLYRSGIVDVRVESGSRLWACWKMNKKVIEKIASIADRDAMDEPYLKSITSIESKDKEFTYLNNKERIEDLMKFFGVKIKTEKPPNSVENPPLFNTITQQHHNAVEQQDHTTIPQYHDNTVKPQYDTTTEQQNGNTTELEHNSTIPQEYLTDIDGLNSELNKDFLEIDSEVGENLNESKSKIERSEDSNLSQPIENKLLSSTDNSKVAKVFRQLEFEREHLNSNETSKCLDLLHELSQSNADSFKDLNMSVIRQFNELLENCSKTERKLLIGARQELAVIMREAFGMK